MTLVEVLIAVVVLLLVSLALLQTALLSIENNMINVLRDEAVGIAEMRMNEARNVPYSERAPAGPLSDGGDAGLTPAICPAGFMANFGANGLRIQRPVRSIAAFDFCTNLTANFIDPANTNKQVIITVGWRWKGQDFTHSISTIMRRQ